MSIKISLNLFPVAAPSVVTMVGAAPIEPAASYPEAALR